ncbi:hypothetical protein BKI52_18390 [marine bacterium AO1-C]|nr:hypothetical protein BKI52_18390 [marine bacterium AO1-C]
MEEDNKDFDFSAFQAEAIKKLQSGAPITGKDGVMTPLLKMFLEKALDSELTHYLYDNKSAKMSLAFEGKLKRDDLGKVYKQMEIYCKKQKTKQNSCTFQNIYQINNFKAGTK